jgi:hypothetical protein
MKTSPEYFSEARPFNDQDDACLLDAMEQCVAISADAHLWNCGLHITAQRGDGVTRMVGIETGDGYFEGATLREALRKMLNTA